MTTRQLIFGADGGGTKTSGVIGDAQGTILAQHTAGPSNQNVVGVDEAARELAGLVRQCCVTAGCMPADLAYAVFGLAGAGEDAERKHLIDAVRAKLGDPIDLPMRIETDARIALEGALGGNAGMIVIAGTGSVVIGKSPAGDVKTIGGWGRVLGDEGSGYRIGVEGLRAVTLELDGRDASGLLRKRIAETFALHSRQEIINAIYRKNFDIPAVAPLVLDAASSGDEVALGILQRAARDLAGTVAAGAGALGFASLPVTIAFCGGLIDHDTVYARVLHMAIKELVPLVSVSEALYPPVRGAVMLALASAGFH
jgi:N-acetylglucosamine kinase-like BadF-type ATPase